VQRAEYRHDSAEHTVRPSVGMLVFFPSYFWHGRKFADSRDKIFSTVVSISGAVVRRNH
jgi:hypothetical protein